MLTKTTYKVTVFKENSIFTLRVKMNQYLDNLSKLSIKIININSFYDGNAYCGMIGYEEEVEI